MSRYYGGYWGFWECKPTPKEALKAMKWLDGILTPGAVIAAIVCVGAGAGLSWWFQTYAFPLGTVISAFMWLLVLPIDAVIILGTVGSTFVLFRGFISQIRLDSVNKRIKKEEKRERDRKWQQEQKQQVQKA